MKEKPLKVSLAGKDFELTRDNVDIYLHRPHKYQDLDYLRIFDFETEVVNNFFRLTEMCRVMAGLCFKDNGFPMATAFKNGQTFRDRYGWYADTYVRDKPSEESLDGFSMVEAAHDISESGVWSFDA